MMTIKHQITDICDFLNEVLRFINFLCQKILNHFENFLCFVLQLNYFYFEWVIYCSYHYYLI
jgi:hypothetical protein